MEGNGAGFLVKVTPNRSCWCRVATVLPSETVYAATKKMRELRVSSVIITSNNKPQGILT